MPRARTTNHPPLINAAPITANPTARYGKPTSDPCPTCGNSLTSHKGATQRCRKYHTAARGSQPLHIPAATAVRPTPREHYCAEHDDYRVGTSRVGWCSYCLIEHKAGEHDNVYNDGTHPACARCAQQPTRESKPLSLFDDLPSDEAVVIALNTRRAAKLARDWNSGQQ